MMALISIVIPVYFNAPSLPALAERLDILAQASPDESFEFIFVDDGSEDESYSVLRQLAIQDQRIRVIRLARNFGSNVAVLAGITYAKGDSIGFIAADLQDPPESLIEMIRLWQSGAKVILAVRRDRQGDPWLDRIFAGIFNMLFKRLVYRGFSPQGVGFFLVDRQVADVLIACREKNAHLIGLILWSGFRYETVLYDRAERTYGKSRWTFGKKLKYFIDAFVAFSYVPLRLASLLGLIFASLGGLYAILLVILRLTMEITVQGWTALMVVVILLSGVQLVILGVIGEYLWRSFDATRQRPLFIVEEILGENSGS